MPRPVDEVTFMRMAIREAKRSQHEPDGRVHPFVGAVVVKGVEILGSACRGDDKSDGDHAEYIALEKKVQGTAAGATVYATLEPCTTRNHPKVGTASPGRRSAGRVRKVPCADRLIEHKVKRVVIGTLDPDQRITGQASAIG